MPHNDGAFIIMFNKKRNHQLEIALTVVTKLLEITLVVLQIQSEL